MWALAIDFGTSRSAGAMYADGAITPLEVEGSRWMSSLVLLDPSGDVLVGTALEGIEGVTIASRAQLLGTYDVSYQGVDFLVRVVAVEGGAYVSAVDPRGLPATAEAPLKVVAALQAALAKG